MIGYFKNAMSKLYAAVLAPVAATRDGLSKRFESVRDIVVFYYNKAKERIAPRKTLQDEVEEVAMQDYVGVEDIKHMYGREKTAAAAGVQGVRKKTELNNSLLSRKIIYGLHSIIVNIY